MAVKNVIAIIAATIIGVFGFILALVFGAQLGGNASLFGSLSASNITKITTNVGNAIVAGSGFLTIIYLGGAGAVALAIFALVFLALKSFGGVAGGKE
jgi:hypothetical protein